MAVRIRLKKLGRRHRPFFRVCAMDARTPRNGKVIEELGYYDPMVEETDARAILKAERIDYWLGVGAKPTPKVGVLIKKYGTSGTHLDAQQEALERLAINKPTAPPPLKVELPKSDEETAAEAATEEAASAETATEEAASDEAATDTAAEASTTAPAAGDDVSDKATSEATAEDSSAATEEADNAKSE